MQNRRAYLQAVRNLPIETQREMAKASGITVVYEFGEGGANSRSRDHWVGSLRAGDEAWVARLDALALPKRARGHVRASADLSAVIADILGRGAVIVDGMTGVTSRDGKRWKERVAWALAEVAKGRPSRAKAQKAGRVRGAQITARAIEAAWKSPAFAAKRRELEPIWRDPIRTDWDAAAAAMPEPFTGRKWLCYRVFGARDPIKKRRGGRKPKRK